VGEEEADGRIEEGEEGKEELFNRLVWPGANGSAFNGGRG